MSRLYEVEIIVRAVIVADNAKHAEQVARNERRDIVRNDDLDDCDVTVEITCESQLPTGWDAECIPFGSEDSRQIGEYLDELPPPRDTKTIDMFVGAPQ